MAQWRHSSGKDEHPSFFVKVADGDESWCKCASASCRFKGTMTDMLWFISKKSSIEIGKLYRLVQDNDKPDLLARLADLSEKINKPVRMPGYVDGGMEVGSLIDQADKLPGLEAHAHKVQEMVDLLDHAAIRYLKGPSRNLTQHSINRWKLGWHPGAQRIAVPQYDRNNRLVNIGGRHVASDNDNPFWIPPSWMHALNFKKEMYLFGEDKLLSYTGKGTVVLVEGMFDVIALDGHGIPNVVAMLGAHLSKAQYQKIVTWFDRIVIVPDGDAPGFEAADRIVNLIGSKISIGMYRTPLGKDPDELTSEEISQLRAEFRV